MRLNNPLLSPAQGLTRSPCHPVTLSLLLLLAVTSHLPPVAFALADDEESRPEFVIDAGGHTGQVTDIAYSPDGKTIASASQDRTIRIWRAEDGQCLRVLRGHTGRNEEVTGVAFCPGGKQLVSAGQGDYGTIRLWDVETGQVLKILKPSRGDTRSIAVSNNGALLAAGASSGLISLLSLASGEREELKGHALHVQGLDFTPSGTRLVSASLDHTARIWDVRTGKALHVLQHPRGVTAVNVSLDGKLVATGCEDGSLRFWDPVSGVLIGAVDLTGHGIPRSVRFNYAGNEVYVAGTRLGIISVPQRTLLWSPSDWTAYQLALPPNGQTLATGGSNGEVSLWDPRSRERRWVARGKSANVVYVAVSPLGNEVAASTVDHLVAGLSLTDGGLSFGPHKVGYGGPIEYTPDDHTIACGTADSRLVLFEPGSGQIVRRFDDASSDIITLAFSGDGKLLAGSRGNGLHLWDTKSGALRKTLLDKAVTGRLAFSKDGRFLLSGEYDGAARLWNLGSGEVRSVLRDHGQSVLGVAFHPDNLTFATTGADGYIRLYDVATAKPKRSFQASEGACVGVTFCTDGRLILAGRSCPGLFDAHSGDLLLSLDFWGTVAPQFCDDSKLITCSRDQTIFFFHVPSGKLLLSFIFFSDGEWATWTPEGYYTASPGGDKYIGWQINRGDKSALYFSCDQFKKVFYRPDVIRYVLKTHDVPEALKLANMERRLTESSQGTMVTSDDLGKMRPPEVTIVSPADGSEVATVEVKVQFKLRLSGELKSVVVTNNGRPLAVDRALTVASKAITVASRGEVAEVMVPLVPGENIISLMAENQFAFSKPATITVRCKGEAAYKKPRLFVLSIGVSDYVKKEYKLNFAHFDAIGLARAFEGQKDNLWREVHVKLLTDREASRANIVEALDNFLRKATQEDVVVITVSGHGVKDQTGKFYFMPCDGDAEKLRSTAVNWEEFKQTVRELPSKVLVLVDACHAGAVDKTRWKALDIIPAIRELQEAGGGVTVLGSSTGPEVSQEREDWKHGAFTFVILEGLRDGKADLYKDGVIKVSELLAYVKNRVPELTDYRQHPISYQPESVPDFAVWKVG